MFGKLKQFFGVVGVDVELVIPAELPKDATTLAGMIRVSAKQDQHITLVKVEIKQVHQEGSGTERTSREYEIGELIVVNTPFDIKEGETKEYPFTLPFTRRMSRDQRMAQEGGVMGALGKISTFMDNEEDNFWVNAMVDVKGAALDPNDTKSIRFI
jgi:hypothetical protein